MSNKEEVEFEAYDAQGNAHLVDVDEVCDESPTTQGSVPEEVGTTGTVKPKPPSEPGGSEQEGKGGRKGRSHGTWASLTPERMPEEDFKALRHPWAPWPVFTGGKKQEGTTEKPVIPGEEKATDEADEWRIPGAYSQNFVLLEDAEARRAEMDEEDSRPDTEEEWQQFSPWRQAREQGLNSQRNQKGRMSRMVDRTREDQRVDLGMEEQLR